MTPEDLSVGARLRDARKKHRLRQKDVAEALRPTVVSVSRWENGHVVPITFGGVEGVIEAINKIARGAGGEKSTIINGTGPLHHRDCSESSIIEGKFFTINTLLLFLSKLKNDGLDFRRIRVDIEIRPGSQSNFNSIKLRLLQREDKRLFHLVDR